MATVQASVAAAKELLLVIDSEGLALQRLWVLFEVMLAVAHGKKLRIRCSGSDGFGTSEPDLRRWEARIDMADWSQASCSSKADEQRLRATAQRLWEAGGTNGLGAYPLKATALATLNAKGLDRLTAQFKVLARREIYGQILVGAVKVGDKSGIVAALEGGANPEHRDEQGNTAEELAFSYGHEEIEELIFERRMQGRHHGSLASFFAPKEMISASANASPEVLLPFMTQATEADLSDASNESDSEDFEALMEGIAQRAKHWDAPLQTNVP